MKATIKDVAKIAGVSIATVSHVINKTRFVSPQLIDRIEAAMVQTGYKEKVAAKQTLYRIGKNSQIALVIPQIENTVYSQYATTLSKRFAEHGLLLSIYLTYDDLQIEQHILGRLATDKNISGIILAPTSDSPKIYAKFLKTGIPLLCLERRIDHPAIDCVLSDNHQAIYQGTDHLIKIGHENIALLLENRELTGGDQRLEGYRQALAENNLPFRKALVFRIDPYDADNATELIKNAWISASPTAFIAGGNRLTLRLLKALDVLGLQCPLDISLVGYGDEEWSSHSNPPLTALNMDAEAGSRIASERMLEKIEKKIQHQNDIARVDLVPVNLTIRSSTQVIAKGPFGEKAHPPEVLNIAENELLRLRRGNFKVGISFHYSGTAWKRLHESGIRDTFDKYGIKVIAVTEAHFDPQLQVTQLESLRIQKPDAIIAIPADDKITARKFKALSRETRLVFISAIPESFTGDDYAGCVTVNERETAATSGCLSARISRTSGRK